MAWTTPSTWVAGAVLTAAHLNAQVRDNFKALGDPWASYSPTWAGSTTNPAIGNGTINAAYMQTGKLVSFRITIIAGSTTTFGSGAWSLSLPVAALVSQRWNLSGIARDVSAGDYFAVMTNGLGGSSPRLHCDPTTAGASMRAVNSTVPFTWANTDELHLSGTYEAA